MGKTNFYINTALPLLLISSTCFATSGVNVQPLTSPSVYYRGTKALSPPSGITNTDYQAIPDCNIVLSSCGDINGNPPRALLRGTTLAQAQAKMNQECPAYCKVSRQITGSGWSRQSTAALCPSGYVAVAKFNMQSELETYTTMHTINPVIGLTQYNCLSDPSSGYVCNTGSPSVSVLCGGSPYTVNQVLDTMPGSSPGTVVKILQVVTFPFLDCSIYAVAPVNCSVLGLAPTCVYYVPTTLICARVAPTWRSF